MVARYAPNKRHAFFFEASAQAAHEIGPLFRIALVGDPSTEPEGYRATLAMAERWGLTEITTHIPFTSDIASIEAMADTLILCSLREPFGNCVCEAMLSGVPVVVAGTGGYLEVVQHGITGHVAQWDSPVALAEALTKIWRNPNEAAAIAERARRHIVQDFSRERYGREICELYESILNPSVAMQ